MSRKYVVVGGGIAGVSCAESLLIRDPSSLVTLISPSGVIKAARNVNELTRNLVTFDVTETPVSKYEADHPNVTVSRCSVVGINVSEKYVSTDTGEQISYDKLCICTGARQNLIFPQSNRVIGIRDTSTAIQLDDLLKSSEQILIVGNGGIATELVFQINNCKVVWAIKDKSISQVFFDAGAAEFFLPILNQRKNDLKDSSDAASRRMVYKVADHRSVDGKTLGGALGPDWHQSLRLTGNLNDVCGVSVEYECEVTDLHESSDDCCRLAGHTRSDGGRWPVHVGLSNGRSYGFDVVISATGVVPNTKLLAGLPCSLALDGGVEVDENMRVIGLYDVYAAGDVCSTSTWPHEEHWRQMRLWTQARQMGLFASQCMVAHVTNQRDVDRDICFEIFAHVTNFFGRKVVLLGRFDAGNASEDEKMEIIIRVEPKEEFVKVVLRSGRMVGAVLVGETDLEETFENLILNRTDLTCFGEDLLNPNIDIADYFD